METIRWRNFELSRMMLGTVQLGMQYGIANRRGQPDYPQALEMVRTALEGGVNSFDTAASYGVSEQVLGRAISDLGASERVVVVTKIRVLTEEEREDKVQGKRAVEASVTESQSRLKLDCLPIVLFHREADAVRYMDVLDGLRKKGRVRFIGVSCDNRPGRASEFLKDQRISALQLSASVLDRRYDKSGILDRAGECRTAIFVRSVFLQGLLVMPMESIPRSLEKALPVRRSLERIGEESGITLPEMAIRYMLGGKGVTSVLTGVETVEQIRENVQIFGRGPLPSDVVSAIDAAVPVLPEAILTPSMW